MLALEVEFLLGRYAAADFRDRHRPEWPPHPARLFSALVAAAHETGLGASARAALLWLESLPPPHIRADEKPAVQTPVTVFVPVNDPSDDLLPQRAERQPRSFPSTVPRADITRGRSAVWFVWPQAEPDETLKTLLASVAAGVSYLGNSRSPVRVRLVDDPPEPNWVPDDEGEALLRVPAKGRLERLEWGHRNGLRPASADFQLYTRGPRRRTAPAPESAFGEMVVFRLCGPEAMEIETAMKVTAALRSATLRRAQDLMGSVPEVLSGHDGSGRPSRRDHAAYIALPFVSGAQRHADGRLLGVAVVLPRGLPAEERRRAVRPLTGLGHITVAGVGRLELRRLAPEDVPPHNLREEPWAGPARRWSSATPVLLDRFPRRGGRGLDAILSRSCRDVGLPGPTHVVADRHSPLFGVEPSPRFLTRRPSPVRGGGAPPARLYTHVTLTFAEAVRGPVLLGAGRYFGLGLMRPLAEGGV
jgi:CRISPR-associated protein Csb2